MKESKREKTVRLILIVLCLLVVLVGIVYSSPSKERIEKNDDQMLRVEVLSEQTENHNPVIAVVKKVQDQPVLIIYEIDRENNYYFKVLDSVSLNKTAKKLMVSKDENGIWVKVDTKQWILFSKSLEVLQKVEKEPENIYSDNQPFKFNHKDHIVSINQRDSNKEIQLDLSKQDVNQPKAIYSLAHDDSLWLVLFQEDMLIAKSN